MYRTVIEIGWGLKLGCDGEVEDGFLSNATSLNCMINFKQILYQKMHERKYVPFSGTNYNSFICTIMFLLQILETHSLCLHVDTCYTRWTCTTTAPTTLSLCFANSSSTTRWKRRSTSALINSFTNSVSRFSPTISSWLQGMLEHNIFASFLGLRALL